jgi:hypothetical protein
MPSGQDDAARLIREEFRIRYGIELDEAHARDLAAVAEGIRRATAGALDALEADDQPQDFDRAMAAAEAVP